MMTKRLTYLLEIDWERLVLRIDQVFDILLRLLLRIAPRRKCEFV